MGENVMRPNLGLMMAQLLRPLKRSITKMVLLSFTGNAIRLGYWANNAKCDGIAQLKAVLKVSAP